jgi:hypothetical protein
MMVVVALAMVEVLIGAVVACVAFVLMVEVVLITASVLVGVEPFWQLLQFV